MSLEFRTSEASEIPEIISFLCRVFKMDSGMPSVEPSLMRWKYHQPRPDWPGSRSYILRRNGELAAHLGVVPVSVPDVGTGLALIDWAAREDLPGVGVTLLRKVAALGPFLLVTGGSDATRAVLPKLGFAAAGSLRLCARVVRPFRQALRDPRGGWRRWLRYGRNKLASWRLPSETGGLQAQPVECFEDGILDYYLQCPGAAVSGYNLLRKDQPVGRLVLSRVEGQCRIARIEAEGRDLTAAYRAAVREARMDPETSEIMSVAVTEENAAALRAVGLRQITADPIFYYPARSAIIRDWSLLDGDGAYLHVRASPYLL